MNGALSGPAAAVVLQAALDLFTSKQVGVNEYANGGARYRPKCYICMKTLIYLRADSLSQSLCLNL